MNVFTKKSLLLWAALSTLTAGCSKKSNNPVQDITEINSDHQWYFFTQNGFEKTSLPQKSGISSLKPWTETLRISDANTGKDNTGIMVVNRLGVIFFEDGKEPSLIQDRILFSDSTASTLIFDNDNPYITLSRSSFFNKNASLSPAQENIQQNMNRPFLVRISVPNRMFYPAVTYGDLKLSEGGEITGTHFDGTTFSSCVKFLEHERTSFQYFKWNSNLPLESLSPVTQDSKLSITESTELAYRKLHSPDGWSQAPKRLKNLLKSIPKGYGFTISCKNEGGTSPRIFKDEGENDISQSSAVISDSYICAVFPDGTTYFNGALKDRPVLNEGKNLAFRLPKLPENYIYGDFLISGNKLAVSWEESDFYKTGRSGFLVVDLGKILYGDL